MRVLVVASAIRALEERRRLRDQAVVGIGEEPPMSCRTRSTGTGGLP
jgi:hypothetical protein